MEVLGTQTLDPEAAVRGLVQQRAGQRLPGERELAARLQISRPRLRAILAGLRADGLVEQRPGSGTYAVESRTRLRQIALLIDARLKLGDDPFFSYLLECLQTAIQAAGARCLIERVDGDGRLSGGEDGALTLGLAGRDLIASRRPTDPPVVGLLLPPETRPERRASVFSLDDREAGRSAARALLGRGYRDIIFVGRDDIPASRERLMGAEETASENGARLHFAPCHLNYAAGLTLGSSMTLPDGPTGLIATNDWLAVGLHAGLLRQTSIRDLPIISFDGLPLASALGIVSLAVPIQSIAEDAVAELVRLSRSPIAPGRAVCYPLDWA